LRRRLGTAGARRAKQFGWDRIATATLASYQALLGRYQGSRTEWAAESA